MSLFEEPATVRDGKEKLIICQLDGFYPEALDIKWMRCALKDSHFQEITEGVVTSPTVKNDDGTFSVTSSLALKPALENNMYQCVAWHRSWLISQSLNVTVFENSEFPPMLTLLANTWLECGILRGLGTLLGKERKLGAEGKQVGFLFSSHQSHQLMAQRQMHVAVYRIVMAVYLLRIASESGCF